MTFHTNVHLHPKSYEYQLETVGLFFVFVLERRSILRCESIPISTIIKIPRLGFFGTSWILIIDFTFNGHKCILSSTALDWLVAYLVLCDTVVCIAPFKMFFFSSDLVFPFWQDGQDSDDPKQSTADMTAFVSFFSLWLSKHSCYLCF